MAILGGSGIGIESGRDLKKGEEEREQEWKEITQVFYFLNGEQTNMTVPDKYYGWLG